MANDQAEKIMVPKTLRVVMLGNGGVGKSAITIQLSQNLFVEKYDPTIEDSFRVPFSYSGKTVVLEVLDTAGTEKFTAMRDLYMKNGNAFAIVYSLVSCSSLADVNQLVEQIARVKDEDVSEIPLAIVGNKSDLVSSESPELTSLLQSLESNYPEASYLNSSAKTRENIDEIFKELIRLFCLNYEPKTKKCSIL
eukprot:TRINITY_DN11394_c0_g1_i1.p1 TRINITY_DN11394_c0_g1~~TRINITY_DN11394_c0_g1_i1.p1  ORF type:complete len:194 (-),score=39.70 TRINITY_DN11394_c0_g1_i1:34-615(-)